MNEMDEALIALNEAWREFKQVLREDFSRVATPFLDWLERILTR